MHEKKSNHLFSDSLMFDLLQKAETLMAFHRLNKLITNVWKTICNKITNQNWVCFYCFLENRVEFEASIDLNSAEDEGDNMPSIIDEEEWTQQNFGDSLRLAQGMIDLRININQLIPIYC